MDNILKEYFTNIANSIRQKTGTEELIKVQEFSNKIRNIDLGIVLPEFLSVDIDSNLILSWTVSDNYMLERYSHTTFYQIDINNQTIVTRNNYVDLTPYISSGMPNIAVISILDDIIGKEESEIKIEYIPTDAIIELPYTTLYGSYSYGFADKYVYTVSDTTNSSSTSKTVKRQNILDGEIEDLGVVFLDNTTGGLSAQVTVGDRIWCYCGWEQNLRYYTNWSRVFDTSINNYIPSLSQYNSALQVARLVEAAAVGNNVYIFGGQNNGYYNMITKHNTETNTFTRLAATLPHGSGSYASMFDYGICSYSTDIYLICANSTSWGGAGNEIWKFDSTTETLEKLSIEMPYSFRDPICVNFRDSIYIFTKETEESNGGIFVFNPTDLTIEKLDIEYNITPQYGHVYEGKVYLFNMSQHKTWTFGK